MEEQTSPSIAMETETTTIIVVNGPEIASGTSDNVTAMTDDIPGVSGVHLLLMCPDSQPRVTFHQSVIDNEHMNRRKSKCCCIYRKPHVFGESSSSSDDECEHCCGHPEVRLRNRFEKQQKTRKISQCSCCHDHRHRDQSQLQPAPVEDEPNKPTEIAGDSGNIKTITESLSLISATTQSLQP